MEYKVLMLEITEVFLKNFVSFFDELTKSVKEVHPVSI